MSHELDQAVALDGPPPSNFDYRAAAELFPARRKNSGSPQTIRYKRFASAAEAIQFAMDEMPAEFLPGTWLEVDEERFDRDGIIRLYRDKRYPLPRRIAA